MADEEAGQDDDKKRKRSDVAQRLQRFKHSDAFSVQTGWQKLCKRPELGALVQDSVKVVTRLGVEMTMLVNCHVLRLMREKRPVPPVNQTLYLKAAYLVSGRESKKIQMDQTLKDTFDNVYAPLRPEGFAVQHYDGYQLQMINTAAKEMETNFTNHVFVHMESRMFKLACLHLELAVATGRPYDVVFGDKRLRESAARLLVTGLIRRPTETTRDMLPSYPVLAGANLSDMSIRRIDYLLEYSRRKCPLGPFRTKEAHLYVPWMWYILRWFERAKRANDEVVEGNPKPYTTRFRLFCMTPQRRFRGVHVSITNTILDSMDAKLQRLTVKGKKRRREDSEAEEEPSSLWKKYFNLGRVLTMTSEERGSKRFESCITTDGVSASVLLSRTKIRKDDEDEDRLSGGLLKMCPENAHPMSGRTIVAIDPGKNDMFTASTVRWEEGERVREGFVPVVKASAAEYHHKSGTKKRTKTMERMMRFDPIVKSYNSSVEPSKVSSLTSFSTRVRTVLANVVHLVCFYGQKKILKMSQDVAIKRKRVLEAFYKRLVGNDPDAVFACGDWTDRGGCSGSPGGSFVKLKALMARRNLAYEVDEYKTSKLCSACHEVLEPLRILQRAVDGDGMPVVFDDGSVREVPTPNYRVRACTNPHCRARNWNRDVNACRNIAHVFIEWCSGRDRPLPFVRPLEFAARQPRRGSNPRT